MIDKNEGVKYNQAMNINDIVGFLSDFSIEAEENPNLSDVVAVENIGLPLAFAVKFGYATLTSAGEQKLLEVYGFLLSAADEQGIELSELAYTEIPVTPRKMSITV
jgi:hypothetical protein